MARPHPLYLHLQRSGITAKELGVRTGFSLATISRVLNGRQKPSPLFRALCAEALDVAEAEVFPEIDVEVPA